ncbi:MAG: Bug family tripartite tricarboxylate transporter substrate binding protein [Microvirga sp.]
MLRFVSLLAFVLSVMSAAATAADYPVRAVKWVVPYPVGGSTDVLARLMAQWLADKLGQPFVVENKSGGGNNIGTELVVRSAPDGYTMLLVNAANGINATLYKNLPFNFIRDIVPVAGITRVPNVMEINPEVPARTVKEFIDYAKANPGKINMASSGLGTSVHLSGELFRAMTGVEWVHVPFRGAGPALTAMIAGQVHVLFDNLPSSIEHVKAGNLRGLAVTTAERSPALPDVPTVAETVPGYEASAWFGIGVPKATPPEIIDRLNKAVNEALNDKAMVQRLADLGGTPMGGTPAEFGKIIADETEKWRKVVEFSGAKLD